MNGGHKTKRGRFEMTLDLLWLAQYNSVPTRLMQQSNFSGNTLNEILDNLTELGLLRRTTNRVNYKRYFVTNTGLEVLGMYDDIRSKLKWFRETDTTTKPTFLPSQEERCKN